MTMIKNKGADIVFRYLAILAGLAIAAFGVVAFVLPSGIIIGSATGLSRIVYHYIGVPISYSVAIINTLLFLTGAFVLGKKFALSIAVSTFAYPIFMNIFERIDPIKHMTDNTLLATIYSGVIIGIGLGIVIKFGASSGGTDVIAIIFNKKWHIPLGITLYTLDFFVLLGQVPFVENLEKVLLGIMMTFLCSMIADKVVVSGGYAIQLIIISKEYDKIRELLKEELVVGNTVLHGESGYLGENQPTILCLIQKNQLNQVQNAILTIDPEAFIVINAVKEVKGRGFSFEQNKAAEIRQSKNL